MLILSLIVGAAICSLLMVAYGIRSRRWSIAPAAKKRLRRQWEAALALSDPARRVLECDNVFSAALREAGVPGGLGAQLKLAGARFSNREALWRAHKLRNRIAHEPGTQVTEAMAATVVAAFGRALEPLLR